VSVAVWWFSKTHHPYDIVFVFYAEVVEVCWKLSTREGSGVEELRVRAA
jgi:hypothetical protein